MQPWTAVAGAAGIAALILGACQSDDSTTTASSGPRGGEGESCQARSDCGDELSCISNVCVTSAPPSEDAGPATSGLGSEGESCQARSNCEVGLRCIANVCVSEPPVEPDAGPVTGAGSRGESCRNHADCAAGLACIDGECGPADFGLTPTGKECVRIECRMPSDCCPEPSSQCDLYDTYCQQGQMSYCALYDQYCVCDVEEWSCESNACAFTPKCSTLEPCNSGVCAGGFCVDCAADDDCFGTQVCVSNDCVTQCEAVEDCPFFHSCEGSQCVETGCQADHECVASTRDPEAVCASGECKTPCESDLECNPSTYVFSACVEGYCVDVGCETHEECRIRMNLQGSGDEAECRPVAG